MWTLVQFTFGLGNVSLRSAALRSMPVDYFVYMFAILFMTLGPLKLIPVFYSVTHNADFGYRAGLAMRSTLIATGLVLFIAFSVAATMQNWRVSLEALTIAGGIILFIGALNSIMGFSLVEIPTSDAPDNAVTPNQPRSTLVWMGKPTLSPIVVPAIITPTGVVAILFFLAQAEGNEQFRRTVFLMLGLMMLLNLAGMFLAAPIMRIIGLPLLQIISWVAAVVQAGLAVQIVLNSLRSLKVIP